MFDPKALRSFLDVLSDAVMVIDRSVCVSFANIAALRLLACDVGASLQNLTPLLGESFVAMVAEIVGKGVVRKRGSRAPALPETLTLPDGRLVSVALTPLEGGRWALRLTEKSVQAPGVEPPSTTATPRLGHAPTRPLSAEFVGVFWDSPFPATLQDREYRLLEVNQAYLDFTGLRREQLIGRDPVDLQPKVSRESHRVYRQHAVESQAPHVHGELVEHQLIHADGRERWFRAVWRSGMDEHGRLCYLNLLQDSTAEHVAQEWADHSMRELDDWFDLSPIGMVLFDAEGLRVRTNPAFDALVGSMPEHVSDADPAVQSLLGWEHGRPKGPLKKAGSAPIELHARVQREGGIARSVRSMVRCYQSASGHKRYMAVVEDRSLEEERDLAQSQIGALMDTAGVGLATFQESSGWVQYASAVSSVGAELEPQASAELQTIRRDVVVPESLPEYERLQHALRHSQRAEVRYAIEHPDLGQRWLLTRVEPATLASGKHATSVVTLDITEQHQSEKRSEQLLRELNTILESTTAGIAYLCGDMLVRCNSRFEGLLGLGAGEAIGYGLQELLGGQTDAVKLAAEIEAAISERGMHEAEIAIDLAGRARQWCLLSVRQAGDADSPTEVIAVLSDITRLKAQQIELEALARDRELMFSLSEVGMAFIRDDHFLRANDALCRLTGYDAIGLATVRLSELFSVAADSPGLLALFESGMQQRGGWTGERQLRRRDDSLLWVQVSARLVIDGDPSGGFIASYVNVDDRRRAQQAVALQAKRTRAILDSVLVGIVTVGPSGIEWMNCSACRMFGGDLSDFIHQPISTVATPEPDHPFRNTQYLNDLTEGQAESFECRLKARDGREFWVVGNAVATGREAADRQLTYALLDIERRRQAEVCIAEAQSSLQRIIEAAPLAISLCDARSLRILQVNQVAAQSVGHTPEQLVGRTPEDIYLPEEALLRRRDMEQALVGHAVTQREYRLESDTETRIWDARYLPLAAPGHPPDQLLMVATDVTEQRAAQEARFEAAIAQREMLVKEVHHRIKNNLQGVAGLLQQIATRKPEMAEVMSEVVGQVQAIAQVYGLQVGMIGPLLVRGVLEAITGSVQRTFGRAITLTVEGPDPHLWALPEAESIPIALTLNELLTNAIKHGQHGGGGGASVTCKLVCTDAGVRIIILNRGTLPQGFSLARFPGGVSGLGLVRALLPRRSASLTIEHAGGEVVATITLVSPGVTHLEPERSRKDLSLVS